MQGWDFARGGAQKARFAWDESGFFGGNEVERRDERDAAHGVCFSDEGGKAEAIGSWRAARGGSVKLCEVGDEQQGGEGVEVEGAVVTEGEDDDGGAIEGGEGCEGGVEHSGEGINEVGRWGRRWFRFDNAKVGLCRRRGAMSETLHGEEPKVGARALQGLRAGAKGRAVRSETRRHSAGRGGIRWDGATFGGTAGGNTVRRGTKKARPRGADRAGGGFGAKVT